MTHSIRAAMEVLVYGAEMVTAIKEIQCQNASE
jgi:hypothetical protein